MGLGSTKREDFYLLFSDEERAVWNKLPSHEQGSYCLYADMFKVNGLSYALQAFRDKHFPNRPSPEEAARALHAALTHPTAKAPRQHNKPAKMRFGFKWRFGGWRNKKE